MISGDNSMQTLVETLEGRDDLVEQLRDEFRRELMDHAMKLVRPRVAARYLGCVSAYRN